jgi:histone deacetylase 6
MTAKRNVNIPWATKGMGDGDYMFAFQQIVMPIANEFDPDLVIGKFEYGLEVTVI